MAKSSRDPESHLPLTPVALEILLCLGEGERHGYDILLAIEERTEGRLSPNPGTLYRAIDRLAREGLVDVRELGAESPRAARKMFRLSPLGRDVVRAEAERLERQVAAARRLLRRPGGA